MKFSLQKTELQKALQELALGVPNRSTLPILSCGLFVLKGNNLAIRTTDLEISLLLNITANNPQDGTIAIPMAKLNEICSAMPEEEIHFETSDIGKLTIKNSVGNYTIMGHSPDEYPAEHKLGETTPLHIDSDTLLFIILNTIYAVSKEDLKPALQGVLFKIEPTTTTAVSTDGHRLVRLVMQKKQNTDPLGVIIPYKFLNIIKNRLNNEKISSFSLGENHVRATFDNFSVSTRIIKEKYPDYESVIPKDNNFKLIVDKTDFLNAVKRVSIFSNRATKQVALILDENKLTISTEDPENITTGKENVFCKYVGDKLTIGYNSVYLKEVLTHCDDGEITIMLKSSLGAGVFLAKENEDIKKTTLLMPIRLND